MNAKAIYESFENMLSLALNGTHRYPVKPPNDPLVLRFSWFCRPIHQSKAKRANTFSHDGDGRVRFHRLYVLQNIGMPYRSQFSERIFGIR